MAFVPLTPSVSVFIRVIFSMASDRVFTRSQGALPPQLDPGAMFVVQILVRPCNLSDGFTDLTYIYLEGGVFDSYQEAITAIKTTLEDPDCTEVWSDYTIVAHYPSYNVGQADAIRCFYDDGRAYIPKVYTSEMPR